MFGEEEGGWCLVQKGGVNEEHREESANCGEIYNYRHHTVMRFNIPVPVVAVGLG